MSDDPDPPSRVPHGLRALRHRDFRLYFSGQLVSLIGTWMQTVAQSWLVFRLAGESERAGSEMLGLIGFAGQIPIFLLITLAGSLADVCNRRTILLVTQSAAMGSAFLLAGLGLADAVRIWHVFALAIFGGIVMAVETPARQALVIETVGKENVGNAIALTSAMATGARVVGPAVAGLVIAAAGESWCFLVNGLSFLAMLVALSLMRPAPKPIREDDAKLPGFDHIVEGFTYVAKTGPVRSLMLLIGLSSLMGLSYMVLMPVIAHDVLGGGARAMGILMSATGLGALLGAVVLATRKGTRGMETWVAGGASGFGLCVLAFSFSRSLTLSAAILVPAGFSMMLQMGLSFTLVQTMAPDRLRGRVSAVFSLMFIGMGPFGSLIAGFLASRVGAPRTVAIGGASCLVGAAVFALGLPAFRDQAARIANRGTDVAETAKL